MKGLVATVPLFLIFTVTIHGKGIKNTPFETGNTAFNEGHFGQALTNYQAQVDDGAVSAPLHFNLATAAFYDSQLGRAIFHYRQAYFLAPRDQAIRHNLKLARDEVHNGSPPKPGVWQRLTGFFTLNEWTIIATIPLTVWLIWLVAINTLPDWQKRCAIIRSLLGGIAVILTLIAIFTWRNQTSYRWAVIKGETVARFGPVKASPDQFKWFDGAEVEIDRVHGDWFLARDITGRQGWVHSDSILRPGS